MPQQKRITRIELNRALLARQGLLERDGNDPHAVIRKSLGIQAQGNEPPFVNVWNRADGFSRQDLHTLLQQGSAVRATTLRSTLHIVDATDFIRCWPIVRLASWRTFRSNYRHEADTLDLELLADRVAEFLTDGPKSFPELRTHLSTFFPDTEPGSLSWAARSSLPLVQIPPAGFWGNHESPRYALPEGWRTALAPVDQAQQHWMARRYLEAFGPATRADMTAWAGVSLAQGFDALRDELITFEDESGRTLYDLVGQPLPPGLHVPPVRFLHSWDNALLAHKDRTRIVSPEAYRKVFLTVGRVLPTVLVDGFVEGTWDWSERATGPELTVGLFKKASNADQEAIANEGRELLKFLAPDTAADSDLRVAFA